MTTSKEVQPTSALMLALEHVKRYYPNVCMVAFSKDGTWQYMDEDFNAPKFGNEIDTSLLENAADSITSFPYIYQL